MRFTKENVRLDELSEAVEVLQGDASRLERMGAEDLPALVSLFSSPEVYTSAHLTEPPNQERLEKFLIKNLSLLMWKVFGTNADGTGKAEVGYIGWVNYAGPPFLFVVPLGEDLPLHILQNGFELIIKAYFELTPGDVLCFYTDVPVPEEIHQMLVEGGFDLWQEVSGVDPERESTYMIERDTYAIYYGDDPEEDDL